jgi:cytochrome P450 family 4
MVKLRDKFGEIYHMDLGYYKWNLASSPKLVEMIANNESFQQKANGYDVAKDWLGNGLLTSTGHQWFVRRKALTPAFHFKILEKFVQVMAKQCDILVGRLHNVEKEIEDANGYFDIFEFFKSYTLDNICETSMGVCCDAQGGKSEYAHAINTCVYINY